MLVLSRKDGERFRIGPNIYVTLIRAANGKARLGIEAPGEVPVVRSEIDTQATAENQPVGQCPMGNGACPLVVVPENKAG